MVTLPPAAVRFVVPPGQMVIAAGEAVTAPGVTSTVAVAVIVLPVHPAPDVGVTVYTAVPVGMLAVVERL